MLDQKPMTDRERMLVRQTTDHRIALSSKFLRQVVPGHVFQQKGFRFEPAGFITENYNALHDRTFEANVLITSFEEFVERPTTPMIYCVASSPADQIAKLMAAMLTEHHMRKSVNPRVVWQPMYNGFANPLMEEQETEPTMIVLYNLSPTATPLKLDKVRDLIERYQHIPRVLVVAGTDPVSFCSTKLHVPVHGVFYEKHKDVKQVEVL